MRDRETTIEQLKTQSNRFCAERSWQRVNTAKNLVMALGVEAGELMEHFHGLPTHSQPAAKEKIAHELADIFFVLLEFCNTLKIDLTDVFNRRFNSYDH